MSRPSLEGPRQRGVILILEPCEVAEREELPILEECLRRAGLAWVERPANALSDREFSALWVRGSLSVRGYLDRESSSTEPLDRHTREIIRAFFHAGKPIAAPCMGLAVVIEALADLLPGSLALSAESSTGTVAIYSALRLVTTSHPLIGCSPAEVADALTQVVNDLQRLLSSC